MAGVIAAAASRGAMLRITLSAASLPKRIVAGDCTTQVKVEPHQDNRSSDSETTKYTRTMLRNHCHGRWRPAKALLHRNYRVVLHEHKNTRNEEEPGNDENLPWIILRTTLAPQTLHKFSRYTTPMSALRFGAP